ncbi:MAG: EamA family transporter [Leucobacter sp.]
METKSLRSSLFWIAVTSIAPVTWGATYYVTRQFLPADIPLWGAALRALPAGVLLLLLTRRLPSGSWWWRAPILGALNFSAFFVLVFLAAQILPSSIASSIMALAPFTLGMLGWALLGRRLQRSTLIGAVAGLLGVLLIVGLATGRIDGWGVVASLAALLASSFGSILTERWRDDTPIMVLTSWQLVAGGAILAVVAFIGEGAPPSLPLSGIAAMLFISVVATALAFVCWFTGLAHLSPGVVGIVGLLNPVTGVLLGTLVAGEALTPLQLLGIMLVLGGILISQRNQSPRRTRLPLSWARRHT